MSDFVDHLQILPVPSVGGVRQPDGEHRPGGLGMLTLAQRLERRGWTARVEDIGFEGPLPEKRAAESYARSIADGVLSAGERSRFPILLSRVAHGALGVVDALGPELGVVWVSPRGGYARGGLLRRVGAEDEALALVTGRARRDRMAVRPVVLPGERIVLVDARRVRASERRALAGDGIRIVDPGMLGRLDEAVADVGAGRWYLHVDCDALESAAVPAADDPEPDGIEPDVLATAIADALPAGSVACVGLARYDLNRDADGRTADTLVELIEAAVRVAGGEPRPGVAAEGG